MWQTGTKGITITMNKIANNFNHKIQECEDSSIDVATPLIKRAFQWVEFHRMNPWMDKVVEEDEETDWFQLWKVRRSILIRNPMRKSLCKAIWNITMFNVKNKKF